MVAAKARSCFVSSWRINHFGIKPVRGGRPPSDSRIRGSSAVVTGVTAQDVDRELIVVVFFRWKIRNEDDVIKI